MEDKELSGKLQSALEKAEKRLACLEAQEKRRRTVSLVVWLVVLAAVIVGVCVYAPKLSAAVDTVSRTEAVVNSLADALENVDLERLSANLAVLGNADTEKLRDFVGTAGKIDFKALGEQIDSIRQFGEKLSSLNLDGLKEFCEKLSEFSLDSLTGEGGLLSGLVNMFR